jgi:hypothetical protein
LKFEYSSDGSSWVTAINTPDSSFSGLAGGVDIMCGFANSPQNAFIGDLKYATWAE